MHKCHYCSSEDELRPYGPDGAYVCFDCAMATPERRSTVREQFEKQLAIAAEQSNGYVVLGGEHGPMPYIPKNKLN